MIGTLNIISQYFTAAADQSAKQYYIAKISAADTVAVCAAATDVACGVILEGGDASTTRTHVGMLGVFKVRAGAAITVGARITPDADGEAITAASGNTVIGYALETATAQGQNILCFICGPSYTVA